MPTIKELLEIASRYPTNMADAMFAACVEKAAETSDAAPRAPDQSRGGSESIDVENLTFAP